MRREHHLPLSRGEPPGSHMALLPEDLPYLPFLICHHTMIPPLLLHSRSSLSPTVRSGNMRTGAANVDVRHELSPSRHFGYTLSIDVYKQHALYAQYRPGKNGQGKGGAEPNFSPSFTYSSKLHPVIGHRRWHRSLQ